MGKGWQQGPARFPAPGDRLLPRAAAHSCQVLEPGLPQDSPGFGTVLTAFHSLFQIFTSCHAVRRHWGYRKDVLKDAKKLIFTAQQFVKGFFVCTGSSGHMKTGRVKHLRSAWWPSLRPSRGARHPQPNGGAAPRLCTLSLPLEMIYVSPAPQLP